jgi:hypothetical protein
VHRQRESASAVRVRRVGRAGGDQPRRLRARLQGALEGNPYDGRTLKATVDQVTALSGVELDRIYVDSGYRVHD